MQTYPIKLTYHVRSYYFGERLIPELLGKKDAPEGVVAETWEISDYKDTTGTVKNGPYAGKTLHDLVEQFPDELVGEGGIAGDATVEHERDGEVQGAGRAHR